MNELCTVNEVRLRGHLADPTRVWELRRGAVARNAVRVAGGYIPLLAIGEAAKKLAACDQGADVSLVGELIVEHFERNGTPVSRAVVKVRALKCNNNSAPV